MHWQEEERDIAFSQVKTDLDLFRAIDKYKPGDAVTVQVSRLVPVPEGAGSLRTMSGEESGYKEEEAELR